MFLGICSDTDMQQVWGIVKAILWIIRIAIPLILVIIGTVTFGKAIIADDDKEIKSAVTKLIKKVILAVIIFVLPIIVKALFNTLLPSGTDNEWQACINAVL
jgi:surface polysaccharide O-acyltransferase-like enzyme